MTDDERDAMYPGLRTASRVVKFLGAVQGSIALMFGLFYLAWLFSSAITGIAGLLVCVVVGAVAGVMWIVGECIAAFRDIAVNSHEWRKR